MCFLFVVLFNDDVNCQDCVLSVVDKWISMEHCWDYTDGKTEEIWDTLATTNPTWTVMGSDQDFRGESSQLPAWAKYSHVVCFFFCVFLYSLQCREL